MTDSIMLVIKGFILGATFMMPGVSGAIIAIMLGMYDKMIIAVSNLRNEFKKNAFFLFPIGLGAIIGLFLVASTVTMVVNYFFDFMMYFLLGSIIGSVPIMLKKSTVKKISVANVIYVFLGVIIILTLTFMPQPTHYFSEINLENMLFLSVAGLLLAAAIILPGLGTTAVLATLGIFDFTMQSIATFYWPFLIPLGLFTIIWIALTIKFLEKALIHYPNITYLVIIGLMLGSIIEVFPGSQSGLDILISVIMFIIGMALVLVFSFYAKQMENKSSDEKISDKSKLDEKM